MLSKQSSSDHLANPDDVKLEFGQCTPNSFGTAQPKSTKGKNPFEETSKSEGMSSGGANLNLSEGSVDGPNMQI